MGEVVLSDNDIERITKVVFGDGERSGIVGRIEHVERDVHTVKLEVSEIRTLLRKIFWSIFGASATVVGTCIWFMFNVLWAKSFQP